MYNLIKNSEVEGDFEIKSIELLKLNLKKIILHSLIGIFTCFIWTFILYIS